MERSIAVVYMAAGLSSRFGGKIKQLAKVGPNEESLIEYSLNQALKAGVNKIYFIVGEKTEKPFKETFGSSYRGIPIVYTFQPFDTEKRNRPWGSLDALCTIRGKINSLFIACNGDDLYGISAFKKLVTHLKEKETCATIGYKLKNSLPEKGKVNRGIFKIENNKVTSLKEVLDIGRDNLKEKRLSEGDLCSMNIFALTPEILELLYKKLILFKEENKNDKSVEAFLPHEISTLIKENKLILEIYPTDELCLGITNPEDEIKLRETLNKINKIKNKNKPIYLLFFLCDFFLAAFFFLFPPLAILASQTFPLPSM